MLDYDIVIYDTPTGISRVTMAIGRCSEWMLAPQRPEPLCLRSLPQILRMIAAVRAGQSESEGPRLAGFILSISDPDDPSNLEDQREFRDRFRWNWYLKPSFPIIGISGKPVASVCQWQC